MILVVCTLLSSKESSVFRFECIRFPRETREDCDWIFFVGKTYFCNFLLAVLLHLPNNGKTLMIYYVLILIGKEQDMEIESQVFYVREMNTFLSMD